MKLILFIVLLLLIIVVEFFIIVWDYQKTRLYDELLGEMQEKYLRIVNTRIDYPYIYKDICQ